VCPIRAEPNHFGSLSVIKHPRNRASDLNHADELVTVVCGDTEFVSVDGIVMAMQPFYKIVRGLQLNRPSG
jgi:hypothetical protein